MAAGSNGGTMAKEIVGILGPESAATDPERLLIDLLAEQIEDDEWIIEGLGAGTLSLGDLERWRSRRWEAEKRFLHESGRLIESMCRQGFGTVMSTTSVRRALRLRRQRAGRSRARRPIFATPSPAASFGQKQRFSLELGDLGLPCSLRVVGNYDEVLDAGVWHARHAHGMRDGKADLRDSIKSAIIEQRSTNLCTEELFRGERTEAQVSSEAFNQTLDSGL